MEPVKKRAEHELEAKSAFSLAEDTYQLEGMSEKAVAQKVHVRVTEPAPGEKSPRSKRPMTSKALARKRRFEELKDLARDPEIQQLVNVLDHLRPSNRGECLNRQRPCLFVGCKSHLYLDVNPETGHIKFNFPDLEVWEMAHTCALDIADRGGTTLEEVGRIMNLTRERIRQLEARGLEKLQCAMGDLDLTDII